MERGRQFLLSWTELFLWTGVRSIVDMSKGRSDSVQSLFSESKMTNLILSHWLNIHLHSRLREIGLSISLLRKKKIHPGKATLLVAQYY